MNVLLAISYFVHLVATVVWIGGLAIFVLLVWPAAKRTLNQPETNHQFLATLQERFRPLANLSLLLLLGTGMVQTGANENYEALLTFTNTWTQAMLFKHIAFGGMILVAGILQFGIAPALERAKLLAARGQANELEAVLTREAHLTQLMLGLGILVLVCTAIATAV
ncbi:MAG: hypothetical protein H6673_13805 [Anaerolineales bacterium]|nr:hypothetical protein [Anaerolineales bacterium]